MMVPLVITPREVYIWPLGFFFTSIISRLKVHLSSGCVTWALVNCNPEGRIKRSYFGGFLVKAGPTNVAFVIILFHCLVAKEIRLSVRLANIIFANLFYYSAYLLLFMGLIALFDTIHRFHCIISINFYLYLQYFQQKIFSFSKIRGSQTDP